MPTPAKYEGEKVDRGKSTSESHSVSVKNEVTDSSTGSGNSHDVNTNLGPQISAQNANIVMHIHAVPVSRTMAQIAASKNHATASSSPMASSITDSGSSSMKNVSKKKPVRLRKNISLQKAGDELGPIVRSTLTYDKIFFMNK